MKYECSTLNSVKKSSLIVLYSRECLSENKCATFILLSCHQTQSYDKHTAT